MPLCSRPAPSVTQTVSPTLTRVGSWVKSPTGDCADAPVAATANSAAPSVIRRASLPWVLIAASNRVVRQWHMTEPAVEVSTARGTSPRQPPFDAQFSILASDRVFARTSSLMRWMWPRPSAFTSQPSSK